VHLMPLAIEMLDRFRANQTTGSGYQDCLQLHMKGLLLPI